MCISSFQLPIPKLSTLLFQFSIPSTTRSVLLIHLVPISRRANISK